MPDVKKKLENIEENVSLAEHASFKIGGLAKYFYTAKTSRDISRAVQFAKESDLAYYIIGNGNNILVSDQGFDGLIIRVKNQEIKIKNNEIFVGAGVILANLLNEAANAGLAGLEWLAGIPGTVGGAIYGNAGAFGSSMGEKIKKVEILDSDDLAIKWLDREECRFAYRSSIFKKNESNLAVEPQDIGVGILRSASPSPAALISPVRRHNEYIILSAVLKLEKGNLTDIRNLIKEHIVKRGQHSMGYPNAGSVFKNIVISENQKVFDNLCKKFPELNEFRNTGKIPTGWLIEELGLLGKKIGGAMIARNHGNFILNVDNAKATDVIMLMSLIKQKVRVNFRLQLEEEIQYVGF